jgi:hypothetical protein
LDDQHIALTTSSSQSLENIELSGSQVDDLFHESVLLKPQELDTMLIVSDSSTTIITSWKFWTHPPLQIYIMNSHLSCFGPLSASLREDMNTMPHYSEV